MQQITLNLNFNRFFSEVNNMSKKQKGISEEDSRRKLYTKLSFRHDLEDIIKKKIKNNLNKKGKK